MKCVMNGQRNKALSHLKSGNPVIFATDTVNGIGCIYDDTDCIEKIFRMKKRDKDKPLILLFDSMNRVKEYFELNSGETALAERYMPGALTIIAGMKKPANRYIVKGNSTGFRIPDNDKLRELIRAAGKPVAATSINLSGNNVIKSRDEAAELFPGVHIYGELTWESLPSTIVSIEKSEIRILRKGKIPVEEDKWNQ